MSIAWYLAGGHHAAPFNSLMEERSLSTQPAEMFKLADIRRPFRKQRTTPELPAPMARVATRVAITPARQRHTYSKPLPFRTLLCNASLDSPSALKASSPNGLGKAMTVGPVIQTDFERQAVMQRLNIKSHRQFGVFSFALASAPCLTRRSTGHQRAAHVAAG